MGDTGPVGYGPPNACPGCGGDVEQQTDDDGRRTWRCVACNRPVSVMDSRGEPPES